MFVDPLVGWREMKKILFFLFRGFWVGKKNMLKKILKREKGQQLGGGKNRVAHALGFFWVAHALEEILGAAHALKRKRGSS